MSTGGAAMKAMMKQMVAVNRVGIINTPNQPTYRRLLVLVTHSQKFCHTLARSVRCSVVVIVLDNCDLLGGQVKFVCMCIH